MADSFWVEQYRAKAALDDPIAQTGRGSHFQALEFLHAVRDVVARLALEPGHDLLDVGCANGLLDVVLSACCRSLLAVEPVPELAALATRNLAACGNVRVARGEGTALPADDAAFDRVLVMGVLQLVPPTEARQLLAEVRRVCRPGARVLLGSVPDLSRRASFLDPYLAGVRAATHLDETRKAQIIARNEAAHWYDAEELGHWWLHAGGVEARREALPADDPDAGHRYHLVLEA